MIRGIVKGFPTSPIITISPGHAFFESVRGSPRAAGRTPQPTSSGITGSGAAFSLNRFLLAPRNSDQMPGLRNIDLRVSRQFGFTERYKVEVLAEAFNLFNHQQVNGINQTAYSISGTVLTAPNSYAASLNFNPFNNFGVPNSAGARSSSRRLCLSRPMEHGSDGLSEENRPPCTTMVQRKSL